MIGQKKSLKKITMRIGIIAMSAALMTTLSSYEYDDSGSGGGSGGSVGSVGSGCGTYHKDGLTGTENFAKLTSTKIPQYTATIDAAGSITVSGYKITVGGAELRGEIAIGSGGYTKECTDALTTSCDQSNEGHLIYCPDAMH